MISALSLRRSIRNWVIFFIVLLVISGITAFALETELAWLDHWLARSFFRSAFYSTF